MAGNGPAPKQGRARRNKDVIPLRVVEVTPTAQPKLPKNVYRIIKERVDGEWVTERVKHQWPEQTVKWWNMWAESPLSSAYTDADWSFLLDTALIHADFWNGDLSQAAELRLRVAKFGQTPEDRARLRITFAVADEAEAKGKQRTQRSAPASKDSSTVDPRQYLA